MTMVIKLNLFSLQTFVATHLPSAEGSRVELVPGGIVSKGWLPTKKNYLELILLRLPILSSDH